MRILNMNMCKSSRITQMHYEAISSILDADVTYNLSKTL